VSYFIGGRRMTPDYSTNMLSGVRVLDMTQFEAGPSCTETLAWMGAEVVKLENPKGGDAGRYATSEKDGIDSFYFMQFNSGKKSITCNLKTPEGVALVKKLVREANVFIENFAPGVVKRMGLDFESIKKENPNIIYASVKGFAEGSPYENFLSFDMIGQSAGGVLSITGEPDGQPCKPGVTLADTGTGMLMSITILGALYRQQATGQGEHLQLAMQDAMTQYTRLAYAYRDLNGKAAPRAGAKLFTTGNAPTGIFPCKPGGKNDYVYIYTTRAGNHHWERLCVLLGRRDLIDDPRFLGPKERAKNEEAIDKILTEFTKQYTKREAMKLIGECGVPCGAVLDIAELYDDKDLNARGIFQSMDHPERGEYKMPTWPVKVNGGHLPIPPSPLLGEHVDSVLSEWLDMSAKEIDELKKTGAI
jgi:crotonobetainyl-CoA:carnitine CoA-transferase CaiB-like acyl-CoA transferase